MTQEPSSPQSSTASWAWGLDFPGFGEVGDERRSSITYESLHQSDSPFISRRTSLLSQAADRYNPSSAKHGQVAGSLGSQVIQEVRVACLSVRQISFPLLIAPFKSAPPLGLDQPTIVASFFIHTTYTHMCGIGEHCLFDVHRTLLNQHPHRTCTHTLVRHWGTHFAQLACIH